MQFFIKSSHSLYLLASHLIKEMHDRNQGIFVPYHIVTQTEGMNSWLKQQIAHETGIAVNLKFLQPNELINDLFYAVGGMYEKTLSRTDISWLIYDYLGHPEMIKQFPKVAAYYYLNESENEVKKVALAEVVADLFEQYQVYRPEMLSQWNQGKLTTDFKEEEWQMTIWKYVKEKAGEQFPDKNKIRTTINEKLKDKSVAKELQKKIPAIYFFGTSLLTAYHLEILIKVSEIIPVFVFLPNPSPEIYWYEDESAKTQFYKKRKGLEVLPSLSNPLLLNWGKLIQNSFMLLFKDDQIVNDYDALPVPPSETSTLLSKLQQSIFDNTIPEKKYFSNELLKDGTLIIQSCYSPAREVESLYNYLINLLNDHSGEYSARDIIVQVTDINKYASYIRAIFNNAPYRFNYTIADESFAASDSLSRALYEVLTVDEATFTAEAVIQLLDFDSIKRRFGITNIDLIRTIVDEANIRHGIEGSTENESIFVSWKYGISRIMYGICISGEEEYGTGISGFYPLDKVESSDALEIVRFVHFVNTLIDLISERKEERTLSDWSAYFKDVLSKLILNSEQNSTEESNYLIREINELASSPDIYGEKVPYAVFLRSFLPGLNDNTRGYRFAREGITFCSFIPMRSIPFKIVAMLGLDFNKFPRKSSMVDFDLMTKAPKTGDRNIKTNDKHLFLETLLSAGDFLYMSYNGMRVIDNAKQPPSILIEELLNYIESAAEDRKKVRELLITQQPLHLFSEKYQTDPLLHNYLLNQQAEVQKPISSEPKAFAPIERISLHDLRSFFKDPITAYYKKVLDVDYGIKNNTLEPAELFSLNNLEKWSIKNALIFKDVNIEDFAEEQKKKGLAPLANVGILEVLEQEKVIEEIKSLFIQTAARQEERSIPFELKVDDVSIAGEIEKVFGNNVIHVSTSKNSNKYILGAYLTAVILAAIGRPEAVHFLSLNEQMVAEPISQEEANEHLRTLIALYKKGFTEILVFLPEWGITPEQFGKKEFSKHLETMREKDNHYYKLDLKQGATSKADAEEKYNEVASQIIPNVAKVFKMSSNGKK